MKWQRRLVTAKEEVVIDVVQRLCVAVVVFVVVPSPPWVDTPPRVDTLPQTPRPQHTIAASHQEQPPLWGSPCVAAISLTPINRSSPAYNTRSRAKAAMFSAIAHRQCMSPQHLSSRCFPSYMINAVLDTDTGELMEYRHLMKNPKYRNLYGNSYAKEIGRLAQGMPGQVTGTNTIFSSKK